jgi:hypothetical protein
MTILDTAAGALSAGVASAPGADFPGLPVEPAVPFKAMLLYEDVATARRAAVAALKLAAGLSPGTHVSQSAWRFDLLGQPHWRFKAMAEAAQSDAVIVSSHSSALPPGLSSWLDAALADHVSLIVILLSGTEENWTITIRHTPGFSAAPFGRDPGVEKTFGCGSRPAPLEQNA